LVDENGARIGRYAGTTPKRAASKAFTHMIQKLDQNQLLIPNNIPICLQEVTLNSGHKTYKFIGSRQLLSNPETLKLANGQEITYMYRNHIRKDSGQ
jgi:hypothetical protein